MRQVKLLWGLLLLPLSAVGGQYIPSKGKPIENQFIIVFKDDAVSQSNRFSKLNELATANEGSVLRIFESVLNGGSVKMTEARARALANHPDIAYIEQDAVVNTTLATQTNPTWGLDRIDQGALPLDSSYNFDFDGTGVHAYIIDTGIRATHLEFSGRIGDGYDFIDNDADPDDCNGHGTHVAGTIGSDSFGVAKNVTLHGVRVLNCSGSGSYSEVIAGVDWVTVNKMDPAVANMSLGGGISSSLDNAIANSVANGVVHVVAAGNDNNDACNYSPARSMQAITVASSTSNDTRSSFSNWGSCVDVFAPGSSITSTWSSSDTAVNTISGTSMASPHVAGVAALLLDAGISAANVPAKIAHMATQNVLSNVGLNSPNLLLYTVDDGSQPIVENVPPQASFNTEINGYTVSFTDTSIDTDGAITIWSWDFGDGSTSNEPNPQHIYAANANYIVQLTVSDGQDSSSASKTIRIKVRGGDSTGGGGGKPGRGKK